MMREKQICLSRILKNISYFLVPIFIISLIGSIAALAIMDSDVTIKGSSNFYETQSFSDIYIRNIYQAMNKIDNIQYYEENDIYYYDVQENISIGNQKGRIYYQAESSNNFQYLIIDEKAGIACTNLNHTMKTDTIEEIKELLKQNTIYWNLENSRITTNAIKLSMENMDYNYYKDLSNREFSHLYTSLVNELPYSDDFNMGKMEYDLTLQYSKMALILIPTSIVALIVLAIIITQGIGKKAKQKEIYLNWFDKCPLGVALIIGVSIIALGILCFVVMEAKLRSIIITGITIGVIIGYLGCILLYETIVKRLKTHTFWKSTIIYKICHFITDIYHHRKMTTKLILSYGLFLFITGILFIFIYDGKEIAVFMLIAFWFAAFGMMFLKLKEFEKIRNALKSIYEGNTKISLNPNELKGVLKELAIYIDDIAGGLSNALNESLKSERLKTELITNVSHDIKTPLTSIINYVDLLKKEPMPSEKAMEYLVILDNKSQRLKKLTEDLVEASKASSGNIKLKKEKINVIELIKQVSGEFEDKFKARNLEKIMTLPEEEILIEADGRYMYRILENIYSNVAKYALENTRIYVDVISKQTSVVIQMKNVSKEKLNISADELMQRFVRGDSSRNTEGSGLGLSIASSLTELQGGKFHIYLDGDLFKVTLGFEKVSN